MIETDKKLDFQEKTFAAIDLGSNSFHMAIGILQHDELRWHHRISEKIQLSLGIDENYHLNAETASRALACLERFSQRILQIPPDRIRIVGTNALRTIRNHQNFLLAIEKKLKQRVEIISGREEARLIYLGVSHATSQNKKTKLVIDIGGGSTEFIIGQQFQPLLTESLQLGCVSFKTLFFSDGKLSKANFKQAISATEQQLQHISADYLKHGWEISFGSSGSVKSIFNALKGLGRDTTKVTIEDLDFLIQRLQHFGCIDNIQLTALKPERFSILPSGLSILYGIMYHLKIPALHYSDGALREGIIYDLLARDNPENIRTQTLSSLFQRFSIDKNHAFKVEKTALYLLQQHFHFFQAETFTLYYQELLRIAAQLHEIGISISHTQFHKHGAYILTYSDLFGFSRQEQYCIANLIRFHRQKLPNNDLDFISESEHNIIQYLIVILRLAVLFHHSRSMEPSILDKKVKVKDYKLNNKGKTKSITLSINTAWLKKNPLIQMDLELEAKLLKKANITLIWSQDELT